MPKFIMLTTSKTNPHEGYEKFTAEADTLEEAFEINRQSALRMANASRKDAQKYAPEQLHLYEILDRPQEFLDDFILLTAREYSFENHYIDLDAVTEDDHFAFWLGVVSLLLVQGEEDQEAGAQQGGQEHERLIEADLIRIRAIAPNVADWVIEQRTK